MRRAFAAADMGLVLGRRALAAGPGSSTAVRSAKSYTPVPTSTTTGRYAGPPASGMATAVLAPAAKAQETALRLARISLDLTMVPSPARRKRRPGSLRQRSCSLAPTSARMVRCTTHLVPLAAATEPVPARRRDMGRGPGILTASRSCSPVPTSVATGRFTMRRECEAADVGLVQGRRALAAGPGSCRSARISERMGRCTMLLACAQGDAEPAPARRALVVLQENFLTANSSTTRLTWIEPVVGRARFYAVSSAKCNVVHTL
ncbi:uncharacterized protein B0H18DRAFT_208199 [Fomitopsis serialis]|uniref:uncharacterized protein n=1 Tax=Fomitopsis serialis TaxID=139415 RepID=UPI00200747F1|nr:uncharacterized protein B0H18DRAFT_208199 [Neoantrodia serialis]KAH9929355.1 hypothetical protein B0H18DRAFT_208199 [Neoantrodia serialis]